MRKLERRSVICLTLAAILIAGLLLFVFRFVKYGGRWATFYGNLSIYENGILKSGDIYDRNGLLLSSNRDGRIIYNDDVMIRTATLHAVGDPGGNIATSAESVYKDRLIGYNLLTGTYKPRGHNDDLKLTLDAGACAAAYDGLKNYPAGCVGVYDYKTGEILVMVSSPSYDPEDPPEIAEDDTSGIYINRFLSSKYAPGSTFKTVTAAAALESGFDADDYVYECDGSREVGGEELRCPFAHGEVDFAGAMARSCNGAFSEIANELGAQTMERYTERFGLTGSYDINGIYNIEGSFEFPDDAPLNLGWAGIGQYHDLANPCSMMVYMGALANGGSAAEPRILYNRSAVPFMTERMLSEKTAEKMQEIMRGDVVNGYGEDNFPGLRLCAKTGTAEVDGRGPNAWFCGYLLDEEHPYAFVVCLEDAGDAISTAAPIANGVLQYLVSR